jgi:hypothetical protein
MVRQGMVALVGLLSAAACCAAGPATQPATLGEPAEHDAPVPWDLPTLLKHVPPLRHEATGRLAMTSHLVFRMTQQEQRDLPCWALRRGGRKTACRAARDGGSPGTRWSCC